MIVHLIFCAVGFVIGFGAARVWWTIKEYQKFAQEYERARRHTDAAGITQPNTDDVRLLIDTAHKVEKIGPTITTISTNTDDLSTHNPSLDDINLMIETAHNARAMSPAVKTALAMAIKARQKK